MSQAGLSIATDDWLLFRMGDAGAEAFPLVRSVSLPSDQVPDPSRFTVLAHHREPPTDKYIVTRESLGPPSPPQFRPALVVHASRQSSEVSEAREVRPEELLAPALTQSALASGDEGSIRRHVGALRALLASCRCLELRAGRDIGADPAHGGRLLRRWLEKEA